MTGFPPEGVIVIAIAIAALIWVVMRTRTNRINAKVPQMHSNAYRGNGHDAKELLKADHGNGGV